MMEAILSRQGLLQMKSIASLGQQQQQQQHFATRSTQQLLSWTSPHIRGFSILSSSPLQSNNENDKNSYYYCMMNRRHYNNFLYSKRLCAAATDRGAATCRRQWFSSSSVETRKLPPNLTIDPRSSFAPVKKNQVRKAIRDLVADETIYAHSSSSQQDDQEEEDDEEYDFDEEEEDGQEGEEGLLYIPEPEVVYAIPLPERLHVPVHTLFTSPDEDSKVGTITLHENVFGRDPIRVDLLKRTVNYIRNKKRGRRKAKTKTVSEVSGSGRKLRPQKGQGRARVGHSRPPHFRGGAKAHGPKNLTDYGKTKLNKKVRHLALCHVLSQKLLEGNLIIVNQFYDLPTPKTKVLAKYLMEWGIGGREGSKTAFFVDSYRPQDGQEKQNGDGPIQSVMGMPVNFWLASNNIPNVMVGSDRFINVYRVLRHKKLVLTLAAVEELERRLHNYD